MKGERLWMRKMERFELYGEDAEFGRYEIGVFLIGPRKLSRRQHNDYPLYQSDFASIAKFHL